MISHLGCRRLSTLPRLVEDMRRSTRSPTFPLMDFIAVSQFAFLCPVFANCVSFFPFLIHFPQPNWNDIMPRGSQTEYVPTRPCRRTRDQRQEGPLPDRRMILFSSRKIAVQNVIPVNSSWSSVAHEETSLLSAWTDGMERFWWKGTKWRSNKYIKIKKRDIKHGGTDWRGERRHSLCSQSPSIKNCSLKGLQSLQFFSDDGVRATAGQELQDPHEQFRWFPLNVNPITRIKSLEKTLQSCSEIPSLSHKSWSLALTIFNWVCSAHEDTYITDGLHGVITGFDVCVRCQDTIAMQIWRYACSHVHAVWTHLSGILLTALLQAEPLLWDWWRNSAGTQGRIVIQVQQKWHRWSNIWWQSFRLFSFQIFARWLSLNLFL